MQQKLGNKFLSYVSLHGDGERVLLLQIRFKNPDDSYNDSSTYANNQLPYDSTDVKPIGLSVLWYVTASYNATGIHLAKATIGSTSVPT